jgi:BNR repeat-like domain
MPDTGKLFDIRIKKSVDNGISWQHESVLYKAGASFKNGCWEPAALQLPTGEIQLFFSDESIYTSSDEQNISMLRSADNGATWSPQPQIISCRKNSRDGMPSPIWLPDQQIIAMAIEDPGFHNFKPYIIRSSQKGQWPAPVSGDDPQRQYALADKLPDSIYAGAPCLRRLSTGVTVLSYQSTEGRKGKNSDANAVMVVATGNAQAAGFGNKTFPFKVPEGYHALWNALCITKGDTIIAVSSTNAYSKQSPAIWMIKAVLQKG